MIQQLHCASQTDPSRILTSFQWKALCLLSDAWLAARSEGHDVWQFAVEMVRLRDLGLGCTDIRCLLSWGYLAHAEESTPADAGQRLFQSLGTLALPERTCFVLTAKGRTGISESYAEAAERSDVSTGGSTAALRWISQMPRWNGQACQLWCRKCLVKGFRRTAINQELVLAALEEEGWPPQIDDPLPPTKYIDPKARLHDTIKCLNRRHLQRIIRFGGDGSGRRIRWFFVSPDGKERPQSPSERP